jgi:uncharacterized protein
MLAKRPILVGGLGLSATLWLLDTVQFNFFDTSTLLSAIALGSGVWWWRRQGDQAQPPAPKLTVADRPAADRAIAQLATLREKLVAAVETTLDATAQASWQAALAAFEQQIGSLKAGLDRQTLAVALVGESRSGKTALLEQLQRGTVANSPDAVRLTFQEFSLPQDGTAVPEALAHQDAVLLLTPGDLTESAYRLLKQQQLAGQRQILVFSKQDQYLPADRESILQQLQLRVAALPQAVAVAAIAAAPRPIKVRRHQPNGQIEETLEPLLPDLTALTPVLQQVAADRETLVYATILRQSETLRRELQTALNQVRREQALPLIEQLQWVAGAAAFASPVASLDLLAAVAINGQLIMDLGRVYGFQVSLEEAKAAAGTLASLTVKLGLVELSTQALTAVLKSHAVTYVAGGLVQGLSAAYLTRLAGLSLIEHFEAAALAGQTAPALSLEGLGQRLQAVFHQNSQGPLLLRLVQQGLERLRPATPDQPALSAQV